MKNIHRGLETAMLVVPVHLSTNVPQEHHKLWENENLFISNTIAKNKFVSLLNFSNFCRSFLPHTLQL